MRLVYKNLKYPASSPRSGECCKARQPAWQAAGAGVANSCRWPRRPVFALLGRPGGLYSLREPSRPKAAVSSLRVTIPDASLADPSGLSCRHFAAPGALAEQLFESRPGPAGRFASLDSNAIQQLLEGQRNDRHDEQNPLEISTAR